MMGKSIGQMFFCVLAVVFLLVPNIVSAEPEDDTEERAEIGLFKVQGSIDQSYAVTEITEVLYNNYDHAVEETFVFQVPNKAFISNFSLTIDGVTHYAEVVPKEEAKKQYQQAKESGKNAGLLETRDTRVFSYSVNCAPKETVSVGLRYEEYLLKQLGTYTYLVFLDTESTKRTIKELEIDVHIGSKLEFIELDIENYEANTQVYWDDEYSVSLSYSESNAELNRDFIVKYETRAPPKEGLMLNYFNGEEGYFFHVFSPEVSDIGEPLDKDIIFVLDESGSMGGEKIEQLKEAFSEITNQLPEDDNFNIIHFDQDIYQYKNSLVQASDSQKDKAKEYINKIQAGGSTNINGALLNGLSMLQSYESRAPIIIFLTDGLPSAGVTNDQDIRKNVKDSNHQDTAIFSLGFGHNVDFEFLSALSLENSGYAIQIYEGKDAALQITDFYSLISTPLLRNLIFSYSHGTYEIHDTSVSHLWEGSETVVVGKYENGIDKIQSKVEAQSKNGELEFTDEFSLSSSLDHPFIERFWAYRKINCLIDDIKVQGEKEELVSEVVDLAVSYSFVTPYTSLLIDIKETDDSKPNNQMNANSTYVDIDADGINDSGKNNYRYAASGDEPSMSSFPMVLILFFIILIVGTICTGLVLESRRKKKKT